MPDFHIEEKDYRIYLIPGLAANEQLYTNQMKLGAQVEVLNWISPKKGESLQAYVKRFAERIDQKSDFVLVGTSLGGIISIELNKILKPKKVVVISSVKCRRELPLWIRLLKYLPVHRLFKGTFYQWLARTGANMLGARKNPKLRKLIREMAEKTDPYFIEWAIDQVICWQNKEYPANVKHIHGDRDFLFPIKRIDYTVGIRKGTHLMIVRQHEIVNKFIRVFIYED